MESSSPLHAALRRGRPGVKGGSVLPFWQRTTVSSVLARLRGEICMTGKSILLAGAALSVLAAFPANAQQQTLEDRIRALEQKLGQPAPSDNQPLEDRVKALEDKINQKTEDDQAVRTRLSTLEQQFADTVWTFDNSRPTVQSADGRFLMSLRYRFQFDPAFFDQNSNINSSTAQFKTLASGSTVS